MNYGDFTQIPTALRNKLEMELRSGERIVWTGQPIAKRFARASWPLVFFGLFWTGFSVFWVGAAAAGTWRTSSPGIFKLFPLFGVPFVLIGMGMLTSPIWMKRRALKTVFMITDQRAVIFSQGPRGRMRVESFAPAQLLSITREQQNDGSGDIIFATQAWRDGDGDRRTRRLGFFAVPDVKAVEERLRTLAQKATGAVP